jgi:WD40 repeat protein
MGSEKGRGKTTLKGHDAFVTAVATAPDGKYAVSGSDDNTLKVWDLEQGVIVSNFTGDSSFQTCYISQDGESIVAGDSLGKMHFFFI